MSTTKGDTKTFKEMSKEELTAAATKCKTKKDEKRIRKEQKRRDTIAASASGKTRSTMAIPCSSCSTGKGLTKDHRGAKDGSDGSYDGWHYICNKCKGRKAKQGTKQGGKKGGGGASPKKGGGGASPKKGGK
jgi:hypothetical protein